MPHDSNDSISSNDISLDDVFTICDKLFPSSNIEILNYYTKPFSDEPFGYLSIHDLLSVEILELDESRSRRAKKQKVTLTFFVKKSLPTPSSCQELLFEEESKFFHDVVPQLIEHFTSEPWAAECYLAKDNMLVMEDLRIRGFRMPSVHLSNNQLTLAVASLARFHASSMLLEDKLRQPLNQVYSSHFVEKLLDVKGPGLRWLTTGMEVIEAVARYLDLEAMLCRSAYEQSLNKVKLVPGRRNVLSHGDTWCNNMMFRDEEAETSSCRLVDFQMITYRLYAVDLVQLIYLNADRETRRRLENDLIEVYREVLNECLSSHDYRGRLVSFEEVVRDVRETRVVGLVLAALIFPIAMLSGKLKQEYTRDPEQQKRYMYVSRKDFVLSAFEKSENYRDKIVDVVKELVEFMKSR